MRKTLIVLLSLLVCAVAYATWSPLMFGTGPTVSQKGTTYTQLLTWDPGPGTKTLTEIQYEWHTSNGMCADGSVPPVWSECPLPAGLTVQLCFKATWNCVTVPASEGWRANTAFAGQTFSATNAKIYLKWHVAGTGALSPYLVGETNYASARYTP